MDDRRVGGRESAPARMLLTLALGGLGGHLFADPPDAEPVEHENQIRLHSVSFQASTQDTRLGEVNAALEAAAAQFGLEAETWDDVFKGTLGGEFALSVRRSPFFLTGALSYTRGDVETDGEFVDPTVGPGRFRLRQKYSVVTPEIGIKQPLPRLGRLQPHVVLGLSYVFMRAETTGSVEFEAAPTFNMASRTSDHPDGLGWYGGVALDVQVSKRWALFALWRHNEVKLTATDGTTIDLTAPTALGLGGTRRF